MLSFLVCFILTFSGSPGPDLAIPLPEDSIKRPKKTELQRDSTSRFVRIGRIFLVGNRITRDRIILRELSVNAGDLIYSDDLPAILDRDRKRLINTRLFNSVNIRVLELEEDQWDLLIDMK